MTRGHHGRAVEKVSHGFKARLNRLRRDETVRAIVLLNWNASTQSGKRNRAETVRAVRGALASVVDEIDGILARTGGRKLAQAADALGSLPVETTPAGIDALVSSSFVKAVLEDQAISLLR
jgi:hypothetical protein